MKIRKIYLKFSQKLLEFFSIFQQLLLQQYALPVFMNIQGAFDSTTFAAVQETLESRESVGTST